MSTPFPILRLPIVPLDKIFLRFRLEELFAISILSNKAKATVRLNQQYHNFQLSVVDISCHKCTWGSLFLVSQKGPSLGISIEDEAKLDPLAPVSKMKLKMGRKMGTVPVTFHGFAPPKMDEIKTYWSHEMDGYEDMAGYLSEVFNIQNVALTFYREPLPGIIEYFQKFKPGVGIGKVDVRTKKLSEEDCKYILDKSSNAKVSEVIIQSKVPDDFRYETVTSCPKDSFEVKNAYWVTLDNLCNLMDCKSIKLENMKLTSQEMNQFLKKWMEGCQLEMVDLVMKMEKIRPAVNGIKAKRGKKHVKFHGKLYRRQLCFTINRKDGVTARIWKCEGHFIMRTDNLHSYFCSTGYVMGGNQVNVVVQAAQ